MRPKIAIPMSVSPDKQTDNCIPEKAHFEYVKRTFIQKIHQHRGIPVPVPIINDEHLLDNWADIYDGLFLIGGLDIHPKFYGEKNRKAKRITEDRDKIEIALTKRFFDLKKPIFGICKGIQLIAVAFGGTLYQDYTENNHYNRHSANENEYDFIFHDIEIKENSLLYKIAKTNKTNVNSSHHQMVKKVPNGFKVSATSIPDNVIEAIEYNDNNERFVLGVQWHPEELNDKISAAIFESFINAAA